MISILRPIGSQVSYQNETIDPSPTSARMNGVIVSKSFNIFLQTHDPTNVSKAVQKEVERIRLCLDHATQRDLDEQSPHKTQCKYPQNTRAARKKTSVQVSHENGPTTQTTEGCHLSREEAMTPEPVKR